MTTAMDPLHGQELPGDLLRALPVGALFDCLVDTVFFVKDATGRYVLANTTLATRCRRQDRNELVGKRPSEVLGPTLGEGYEAQDRQVLDTGTRIEDRLELHLYPERSVGWCLTNKFPLRNGSGDIVGVVGISKDLGAPRTDSAAFDRLKSVITHVQGSLDAAPTVRQLAGLAKLTPYQLDRRIRMIFGLSTGQWVLRQRLDHARRLLAESDRAIAEIALAAGYEDQSAFTRQFRKTTGLTPSRFRALYAG
ncbi:MAG: AraC family transcriptional regulator [Pseudomonadota bacterium]